MLEISDTGRETNAVSAGHVIGIVVHYNDGRDAYGGAFEYDAQWVVLVLVEVTVEPSVNHRVGRTYIV